MKLKPARHAFDVLPVVFFVARFQAAFFAWNHEEIQDEPAKREARQNQQTAAKDGPAKPDDEYGQIRRVAAVSVRSIG